MNDTPQKSWAVTDTKEGGWVKLEPKFYDEQSFPGKGDELAAIDKPEE